MNSLRIKNIKKKHPKLIWGYQPSIYKGCIYKVLLHGHAKFGVSDSACKLCVSRGCHVINLLLTNYQVNAKKYSDPCSSYGAHSIGSTCQSCGPNIFQHLTAQSVNKCLIFKYNFFCHFSVSFNGCVCSSEVHCQPLSVG